MLTNCSFDEIAETYSKYNNPSCAVLNQTSMSPEIEEDTGRFTDPEDMECHKWFYNRDYGYQSMTADVNETTFVLLYKCEFNRVLLIPVRLGVPICLEVNFGTIDVLHWLRRGHPLFRHYRGQDRPTASPNRFQHDGVHR